MARTLQSILYGIVLFCALLIVNSIVISLPLTIMPGITTTIVSFIIAAFLDGFVCKKVASRWEEESLPED